MKVSVNTISVYAAQVPLKLLGLAVIVAFVTAKTGAPVVDVGVAVAVAAGLDVAVETGGAVGVEAGVEREAGATVEGALANAVIPGVRLLWVSFVEPDAFK